MNLIRKKSVRRAISTVTGLTMVVWMCGLGMLAPIMGVTIADERPSVTVDGVTVYDGDLISSNATNPDGTPTYESLDIYISKVVSDTETYKRLVLNPSVFNSYGHLVWGDVAEVNSTVMDSFTTSDLARQDGTDEVYSLVADDDTGTKHWVNLDDTQFVDEAGADPDSIYTINSTDNGSYTTGAAYVTVESFIDRTPPADEEVGTGLTLALASDTSASTSVLVDSTDGDGAQSGVKVVSINFAAASDGDVQVNTLALTRGGVPSADTDFADFYLYEGSTYLTSYSSVSDHVLTFNNASGLFTVPAGTTKTITLVVNMDDDCGNSRTFYYGIAEASDVVTDGAAISGSFPINGNPMSVVQITDLGEITIADGGTSVTAIDPGQTEQTIWDFKLTAEYQDMRVEEVKFTLIGTIDVNDITNLYLEAADGTILATAAELADDKTVSFVLDTPYELEKGTTNKHMYLKGDIASGTSRTYTAYLYDKKDIKVYDKEYGVYLTINQEDTYSRISAANETTISTGSLTVTRNADSPSGNVAKGATGTTIGKFDFKATGEAIKVDTIYAYVDMGTSDAGLYQLKLFVDGSQIGTAVNLGEIDDEAINIGNSLIIPAGETKTVEVRADMKTAVGGVLSDDETLAFTLRNQANAKSCDYTRQVTGSTGTGSTSASHSLTVRIGTLTIAENLSMHDYSEANPTGVAGAIGVKVASFALTAGAGEAVRLTSVTVADEDGTDAGSDFGANFQNLVLKHDGAAIAAVKGTLSATEGISYAFSLTDAVTISAGTQYVIDAYADIKTGASDYSSAVPGLEFETCAATGVDTSSDASVTSSVDLQNIYVASAGSLAISADGDTPAAGQLIMGATDVVLAKLKFVTGVAEGVNISRIEVSDTSESYNSSLSNVKLYDGDTLLGTVATFDATYDVEFMFPTNLYIAPDTTKVLTVKASVNAYPNATSGGTVTLALVAAGDIDTYGADSGTGIGESGLAATGTAQDIYRTGLSVVKGASSPAGTATAGTGSVVLHVTATADTNYDAVLNALAFTVNGTADFTGSGSANLYKSTDLSNAISTEAYKAVTFDDQTQAGTDGDNEVNFEVDEGGVTGSSSTACDGIPIGATVRISDNGTYLAGEIVITGLDKTITGGDSEATDDCTITFTVDGSTNTTDLDDGDILYYRPIQPGNGKLYFGAQSVTTTDLVTGGVSLTLSSANGFALADTVTVTGYKADGTAVTSTAGGVITKIASDVLTTTGITMAHTLDATYPNDGGEAIGVGQTSVAVVYTGNIAETISGGTSKTFVIKGDTTGVATDKTLQLSIDSAADINWDDSVNFGIITDTNTMPVTGGSLKY